MTERARRVSAADMLAYDRDQWDRLQAYWSKRANARGTPKWLADGAQAALNATGKVAKGASQAIGNVVPDAVKDVAGTARNAVVDKALRPAAGTAVHLIELANDWAVELQDPSSVLATARKRGLAVADLADLRDVPLKDCDRLLTRETLKWRTAGAVEGAGMGALALVPVFGIPTSIFADVIVMDVLCTSIATRVAYSYGFDAKDPAEKAFIETMVAGALTKQLAKAGPLNEAALAHHAFAGRKHWSAKLREDHRVAAALEKFMARWYRGGRVPVQHVGKGLGVLAIVVGAGTNSHVLAHVADHSRRYCQTRWLCGRYGLPLPAALHEPEPSALGDLPDEASDEGASGGLTQ